MSPAAPEAPASDAPAERFDELLQRLRNVVDKLEGGNVSLEESLRFFEEGMSMCRRGAEILDRAEKRVEVLMAAPGAGGAMRTAPFPSAARDEE